MVSGVNPRQQAQQIEKFCREFGTVLAPETMVRLAAALEANRQDPRRENAPSWMDRRRKRLGRQR
jgi:hypothetical protein